MDHYLTHFGLVLVGLLEALLIGWLIQIESLRAHINAVSRMKLGAWWSFLIKFFVPAVLVLILGADLINELRTPYENYSWKALFFIGVNWLIITLAVALILSWLPWKRPLFTRDS